MVKKNFIKINNVIYLGHMNYDSILYYINKSDYLIIPSYTEGIPFTLIEAMNLGIPGIGSNIHGNNDIIIHNKNGFLFDLEGFEESKNNIDNWNVFNSVDKYFNENLKNLTKLIKKIYKLPIDKYNTMSKKAYNSVQKYSKDICDSENINNIYVTKDNIILKKKLFLNFEPKLSLMEKSILFTFY